ncbi:MAG: hypothetical protein QOJ19_2853 [Acidimicrobiia bacterium]|jgi:hypothetical protein|nr:hypothetical protein [Acidimicrobiia bacterium]
MAEALGARRVIVDDARGNGHHLRITWHATAGQFVVSHWRDDVCVAATRVAPEDATGLIGVLAVGLGDAVSRLPEQPQPPGSTAARDLASLAARAQATWFDLRRRFPRSRPGRSASGAGPHDARPPGEVFNLRADRSAERQPDRGTDDQRH